MADGEVVDVQRVAAGVALSCWFGEETRRVYAILAESEEQHDVRQLVELIGRKGGRVTARNLMRSSSAHSTSEAAMDALNVLVRTGLGQWEDAGPTAQGGRPTRCFVLADTVDADKTIRGSEESGVSSTAERATVGDSQATRPVDPKATVDAIPGPTGESEVVSAATLSTAIYPRLDLDPVRQSVNTAADAIMEVANGKADDKKQLPAPDAQEQAEAPAEKR